MAEMTIGQLAKRTGVGVETIRYYERRALLPEPPRTPAGYRKYGHDTLRKLLFIRQTQELGFTLNEIARLLDLSVRPGASCMDVEAHAEHTIERIDRQIGELRRMKKALTSLTRACREGRPTGECPILVTLND
ncbi:MAG: heavy metal-responsive transcriptional regulator [Gemmatimonadota bacterium]